MSIASPAETPATDAAVASTLRISVSRLARRLRAQKTDDTLSVSQLATLATLERHGPLSPTELADHEKVQPPSMTRTIAAIEGRGLVSRSAHPLDRRQVVVAITADGSARLLADRQRRQAWLCQRLAELDPEEMATLGAAAGILDRLSQA